MESPPYRGGLMPMSPPFRILSQHTPPWLTLDHGGVRCAGAVGDARGDGAVQKARIIVPVTRATIVLIEVGSCARALWTRPKATTSVRQANASSTTLRCVRRSAASSEKLFMTCSPRDVPVISQSEAPEGSWWWRPWATGAARPTSRSPAPRIRYWEDRPKLLGDAVGGDLVCVRHD